VQIPAHLRSRPGNAWLMVVDAMAAAAATMLMIFAILAPHHDGPAHAAVPAWLALLTAAAVGLPVALRRLSPRVVLGVVTLAAVLATAFRIVSAGVIWTAYVPAALALYIVALRASRRWSAALLMACVIAAGAAVIACYSAISPYGPQLAVTDGRGPEWYDETAITCFVMAGAWGFGTLIRWRRYLAARLAQQLAREAVVDERLRIARELHDIVGHSMSLIAVKATVANHLADVRPEETRAALTLIEETSRATLVEIRRVLGVLRQDTSSGSDLAPVLGLTDLRELADQAETAGLTVDLVVRSAQQLPEAMELSIYRIIQEALTNAITHAAPTHCRIRVEADERDVHVEVTDDGPSQPKTPPRPSGGHGLIGINERVTMYGGTFAAGPRGEGGFRLSAHLPYETP
jgi:signal transduction histidine kinase